MALEWIDSVPRPIRMKIYWFGDKQSFPSLGLIFFYESADFFYNAENCKVEIYILHQGDLMKHSEIG